jgi:tripartite-type tricarboxylate transporter receptor subunit TctC
VISPALNPKIPYDPVKYFAPVSLLASSPFIFALGAAVPANTFGEFVALAKMRPRQFAYASTGSGSATHLAVEQIKRKTGIDLTHVAYKGGGPGVVALMAGEVQVMFTGMAVLLPFVKSGKVKGIAISSASRSSLLPAMPTLIESGLPGYTMGLSMGILAPAKTPAVVLRTLNREIVATVRVPEVRERFLDQGAEPIGSTAEAFHEHIVSELRRYKDVIQAAGIQAE